MPRVIDGEHFFELERIDDNTTLVINREEYRGVMSLIMKNLPMMKSETIWNNKLFFFLSGTNALIETI